MTLLYLVLCLCLSQGFPSTLANTYKCKQPNKELVKQLENQYGFDIRDVDQVLTYNYIDTFVELPTRNYTALYFGHIKVNFTGHLLPKGRNAGILTKENFDTNTVIVHHKDVNKKKQCEINEADFLKTNGNVSSNLTVIHKLTEACIKEFACEEWGTFITYDFLIKQKLDGTVDKVFEEYEKSKLISTTTTEAPNSGHYDLQSTWNSIFDIGKTVGINELVGKNNGVLVMPEMQFNFSNFGGSGDVVVKNVTIEGLTSLERTKDIAVHRYKNRYELSTGIKLSNLKIKIPYYKGKYGYIGIDGMIGATVQKLGVSVKLHVDYNIQPCKIEIDEFVKEELENPNVEFTGLSILNWGVQKLSQYFIRNNLFEMAKKMVASTMSNLNCEKYRNVIESVKL